MRPAYEQAVENAQALIGSTEVVKDQQPPVNCSCLSQAATGVFETTLKVDPSTHACSSYYSQYCRYSWFGITQKYERSKKLALVVLTAFV